jgi:flagellin-like hook-associated protein FlgL
LHTAEAQLAQGVQGVTQEFVAGLASAHSAAQGALQDVTSAITTHTGQISSIMGGIHGAIDDANNFVNSATAKLTTFTSALKLNALFKDPCIKSVLGAVASASTLSKLI